MKNKSSLSRLLVLLILPAILFCISFFLPFYDFFYLNDDESMRTETIYGYQSGFVWFYGIYLLLAILAVLTLNKVITHIVNPLVLTAILLTVLMNSYLFNWWGRSPWHPDFRFGHTLCVLSVVAIVVVSYGSLQRFPHLRITSWIRMTSAGFLILIPVTIAGIFFYNQHAATNAPRMTGEGYHVKDGIALRYEWWDWPEKKVVYSKYFSKPESDSKSEYHLDSIRVRFLSENRSITAPSINGKLDVTTLLEK